MAILHHCDPLKYNYGVDILINSDFVNEDVLLEYMDDKHCWEHDWEAALKYASHHLSKKDFSQILADAWIRSENPNDDPNLPQSKLLSMFQSAEPKHLMSQDELNTLDELDATVTIYRGVTSFNGKNVKALSWTLDRSVAEWFASRFDEDGTVYQAQIDKSHIYAYFDGRNESEVIVDPKYLMDITDTESMDNSFDITM